MDNKVEDIKSNNDDITKLKKWKEKFQNAKSQINMEQFDTREKLYLGTQQVFPNSNNPKVPTKIASNVINIHYEFVETMIDSTIPQASVKNRRFDYGEQAKTIENSLANDFADMDIDRINDENERTTQIQGFSLVLVEWNPDFENHLYRGELKLRNIHPKQFVGQPGVFDIDEMDYFFLMFSVTKQYINQRYGVDLADEHEEYPEINKVQNLMVKGDKSIFVNDKVTEVMCFYKDKDGDICKFTFSCDTILEDLPKYFHRKLSKCTKCGSAEEDCQCKHPKIQKEDVDGEVLEMDVQIGNGEVLHQGDVVPYFSPKIYPIALRINIPHNFAFGGQSDIDICADQQDAIKKMTTSVEEKILKGGSVITAPDTMPITLTNTLYQIIKGSPQELAAIRNINLEANVSQDLEVIKFMYQSARDTLGITNAYQGKPDNTAISGKAKEINVQQSSGRLQSKLFNKYIFYKRLFEIMFAMKLAFYDELRPFVWKDENGEDQFGDFNKYKFLDRDEAGELYYVTDFSISADAGAGLPRDKMWLLQTYMSLLQAQVITPVQLLKALSDLQLSGASDLLKQAEAQQQAQQEAQQQQQMAQNGAVPPGAVPPGADPNAQQPQDPNAPQPMPYVDPSTGQSTGQDPNAPRGMPTELNGDPNAQAPPGQDANSPEAIKQKVLDFIFSKLTPQEIEEFIHAPKSVQQRAIEKAMEEMGLPLPQNQ